MSEEDNNMVIPEPRKVDGRVIKKILTNDADAETKFSDLYYHLLNQEPEYIVKVLGPIRIDPFVYVCIRETMRETDKDLLMKFDMTSFFMKDSNLPRWTVHPPNYIVQ